jgi:hypothetical protein
MVTDPPYGVGYDPSWRARRGLSSGKLAQGKVLNDDRADWRQAYALFAGDVAYVWHGALHGDVVGADLAGCGLQRRAQIVCVKQHFTLRACPEITESAFERVKYRFTTEHPYHMLWW